VAHTATLVSAQEYEALAVTEEGRFLELHGGQLVEKPAMVWRHERTQLRFVSQLNRQLDPMLYEVHFSARIKRDDEHVFIPDLCVVPVAGLVLDEEALDRLAIFSQPLPFVAEIWSPSTGTYDVNTKLPHYRARGDLEIWRLHPRQRTIWTWQRQGDGSYAERTVTGGKVALHALPWVTIDADALFV
jgi:Uma2 family endonuclease